MDQIEQPVPLRTEHPRPPRRLPSLWTIARYWHEREGNPLLLDAESLTDQPPYCFACDRCVPSDPDWTPRQRWIAAARYLDRAHLVDRVFGGLDGPQNLVPLCLKCHKYMPSFRPEQGADAVLWVISEGDPRIMGYLRHQPEPERKPFVLVNPVQGGLW